MLGRPPRPTPRVQKLLWNRRFLSIFCTLDDSPTHAG